LAFAADAHSGIAAWPKQLSALMAIPMPEFARQAHARSDHHASGHIYVVLSECLIALLHGHLGQVKEPLKLLHHKRPPSTPTVKPHSPHLQSRGEK